MAAKTDFYSLYEVSNYLKSQLVIVKAVRPEYVNAIQQQENIAWDKLEEKRNFLIHSFCKNNKFANHKFLAEYMGFPLGDIFYQSDNNIEVSVWLARNQQESFAFGQCETEAMFWVELEKDYQDSDCFFYLGLKKPAEQHNIIFIQ